MEFKTIIKKLKNELSQEEEIAFNIWYNSAAKHRDYYKKVVDSYTGTPVPVVTEEAWELVNAKINTNNKKQYWKIAVAASIIGIIALFGTLKFLNDRPISDQTDPVSSTIEVGNDKAILTFADGTSLILTNNPFQNEQFKSTGKEIVYDSKIFKYLDKEIEFNYLTVPVGGEYFVKLADGTKVWLNSDSKLKYPVQFSGNSRAVELLYGEAFFDVASSDLNNGANFIVTTQNQLVEVLGTEFNIKAYKGEDIISTALVEGKVLVTNTVTGEKKTLSPSEQLALNIKTNDLKSTNVDVDNIICWKEGFFRFKRKSLEDIMGTLSRWYDINVVFLDEDLKGKEFNGVFRKKQQIQSILESIQNTREAQFKIEGRTVFIEN